MSESGAVALGLVPLIVGLILEWLLLDRSKVENEWNKINSNSNYLCSFYFYWFYFGGRFMISKSQSNIAIQRTKELGLCNKYQREIKSVEDSIIVLGIIIESLEEENK